MLVSSQESRLREANTEIITARAAQHTLDTAIVRKKIDDATAIAGEVETSADAAVVESAFRRRMMIVAVMAIAVTIVALLLLRRQLDRQAEAKS